MFIWVVVRIAVPLEVDPTRMGAQPALLALPGLNEVQEGGIVVAGHCTG